MGDRTGTKTSLVGKDTARYAVFQAEEHTSHYASGYRGRREGTFKNRAEHGGDMINMKNDNAERKKDIEKCHEGNEFFCYLTDALDSSEENESDGNGR